MVAIVCALKLRLVRNGLRRSVLRLVGLILGGLYALGLVAVAIVGLVALRAAGPAIAASVTTIGFALLTLGWTIMSLLVFGVDETVDPRRFALLPVRARELVPGLTVAGLIGVPGLATVLLAFGLFATWSVGVAAEIATVVTVVVGVPLCIVWSRAVTALFAQALASRRSRDLAVVGIAVVSMAAAIGSQFIGRVAGNDPDALVAALHRTGAVAGWTPFGWIWAVPGAVAQGRWGSAVVHLVLALGLTAGLAIAWRWCLDRNLTSPLETGGGGKAVKTGRGLLRYLPDTPAGAIAERCLRYWRRDPRYIASFVGMLVAPVVIMVTQLISPARATWLIALAPVAFAVLSAVSVTSELAYDGSALSIHLLAGVTGRQDRVGRMIANLVIEIPLLVVLVVVCNVAAGRTDMVVRCLALSLGFILAGMGVALWIGTVLPGKAPPPGANPFSSGNQGGLKNLASFGAATGLSVLVNLPVVALVIASVWVDWLQYLALAVGLLVGVLVLRGGIGLGGRRLDRRGPEVLAEVSV